MKQDTLRARLSTLKIEPPSRDAEDRAIRAGLEAFERARRRQLPKRSRLSPATRRTWCPRHWALLGAVAASLCAVVLGIALVPSGNKVAPGLETIAADIEADIEADDGTIPVADLSDAPEDYYLANQGEAPDTADQ